MGVKCKHDWLNYRTIVQKGKICNYYRCRVCREEKVKGDPTLKENKMHGGKIPGYNTMGYNEGLGCDVRNKSDYNKIVKEKGVIPNE